MKVTVEFEVEPGPDKGGYLIDGNSRFPALPITKKVVEAYEAQKPQVYERNGYTITKRNERVGWAVAVSGAPSTEWYSWVTGELPLYTAITSEEAWRDVREFSHPNDALRDYLLPAVVLAEFLEERGL